MYFEIIKNRFLIVNWWKITNVLKGCENISQNVPIRHQNIRERNCQRKTVKTVLWRNKSRQKTIKTRKEVIMKVKWDSPTVTQRLNNRHPKFPHLEARKQYITNCKRKSSLKGLKPQESWFAELHTSKINSNVCWIQQVILD